MATEYRKILYSIISDVLEIDQDEIQTDSHFTVDLGATSIDIVQILMEADARLHIEIPDSVIERVRTVGDVLNYLEHEHKDDETLVDAIGIASDHAGAVLKDRLVEIFRLRGTKLVDFGPPPGLSVDYPQYASIVAEQVQSGRLRHGILICGTGIGMAICANKHPGIRAAHVTSIFEARMAREHNDANILTLGSRVIGEAIAAECVDVFLSTSFDPGENGRHARRVAQIGLLDERIGDIEAL